MIYTAIIIAPTREPLISLIENAGLNVVINHTTIDDFLANRPENVTDIIYLGEDKPPQPSAKKNRVMRTIGSHPEEVVFWEKPLLSFNTTCI